MKDYEACLSENEEWCVPASLQTVLKSRGIEISQTKISKNFPKFYQSHVFLGFHFDEKLIQKFFRDQGLELKCRFLNPFLHFEIYQGVDIFLNRIKDNKTIDVLVAYDSKFHQQTEREQVPHVSIFLDYSMGDDSVKLIDPTRECFKKIPLSLLINNLHPDKNENYGFYVIGDEQ